MSFTINKFSSPFIVIFGVWLCLRFSEKDKLSSIGVKFDKKTLPDFTFGLLIGFVLTGLILITELVFGWISIEGLAANHKTTFYLVLTAYALFIQCICSVIVEEVFFRGYLFYKFEQLFNTKTALIVTSFIFGIIHLFNPNAKNWTLFVIPFALFLLGVMFGTSFLAKRRLWMPIGLHFAWNFFEYYVFGLNNSNSETALLFITKVTGSKFWVGLPNSSFGPELGFVGIVSMIIGILYFWHVGKLGFRKAFKFN